MDATTTTTTTPMRARPRYAPLAERYDWTAWLDRVLTQSRLGARELSRRAHIGESRLKEMRQHRCWPTPDEKARIEAALRAVDLAPNTTPRRTNEGPLEDQLRANG